jgi:hypothetical protein
MFKSLATLAACSLALAAAACGSAPPSENAASSNQAETATPIDPAFTPCAFDSDCVVVAQAGCCNNGWLAAVSSCQLDAYEAANACTTQNAICPQYVVKDTRVAICDAASLSCEMVAPGTLQCSSDGVTPHACAAGYGCVLANDGSGLGTCTLGAPALSDDAGAAQGDDAGTTTSN